MYPSNSSDFNHSKQRLRVLVGVQPVAAIAIVQIPAAAELMTSAADDDITWWVVNAPRSSRIMDSATAMQQLNSTLHEILVVVTCVEAVGVFGSSSDWSLLYARLLRGDYYSKE